MRKINLDGGLVTKSCLTLVTPWTVAARLLCPWASPGKNTGVGAISCSEGSSWSKAQARVSCISCTAGRFFTN